MLPPCRESALYQWQVFGFPNAPWLVVRQTGKFLMAFFFKSLFFNGWARAIKPGLQSAYISPSRYPNAANKNTSG
jgi:hypothetical protein